MSVRPSLPAQRRAPRDPAVALSKARDAARGWSTLPLKSRLASLSRWRSALLRSTPELVSSSPRPGAEFLSSEIIPLADACRCLERRAARWLRPRNPGRGGRPFWLRGLSTTVHREPLGVVLIIAPSNYPLFLCGVQTLQALAAGNGVVLKPGAGGSWAAQAIADLAASAGLPEGIIQVLDDTARAGRSAVACGFDKILFTGSSATGREVLASAAESLTPATVELSGCDAAIVLPGADLDRASRAICFGLALNGGCTCIAPRRLFVPRADHDRFLELLRAGVRGRPSARLDPRTLARLAELVGDAAPAFGGADPAGEFQPAVFVGLSPDHPLADADIFAPVAVLLPFDTVDEAVAGANDCSYALGASVFGSHREAAGVAARLDVGTVTINDIIVPTADPRLPFGGRRESGFGVTRGREGLVGMTRPKVIARRRGRWLPHLDPPADADEALLSGYLEAAHAAGIRSRFAGVRRLIRAARSRKSKNTCPIQS